MPNRVGVGLVLAATQGSRAWPELKQKDLWQLTRSEWTVPGVIAIAYVAGVALPWAFASRLPS